jgi:hypothetical protein
VVQKDACSDTERSDAECGAVGGPENRSMFQYVLSICMLSLPSALNMHNRPNYTVEAVPDTVQKDAYSDTERSDAECGAVGGPENRSGVDVYVAVCTINLYAKPAQRPKHA